MIWNLYFGTLALIFGFFLANAIALARTARNPVIRKPADWFVFVFRGSPLFIQFFLAYEALVMLPKDFTFFGVEISTSWTTRAWAGALLVLFLNTAAYSAEIFHGALKSIPKGDLEAAEAYGLTGWKRFVRIEWPTMLRLGWPGYTNEAIFLFHATTLVFFSGFPAFRQMGDALYYANYFADKTFNPFIPYPIVAFYFILLTLAVTGLYGLVNRRLNRHLPSNQKAKIRLRPNLIR
jgi:polar amino acid transport system permease protein